MRLDYYIDLYELVESKSISRQESRAFGLDNIAIKDKHLKLLKLYRDTFRDRLDRPMLSEKYNLYMDNIDRLSILFGVVFGILAGIGLLSYSGKDPVNVIYFMAITILFPLVSMSLSIFTMFRIKSKQNSLMEFLPFFIKSEIPQFKISQIVRNYIILKRTQIISLIFSIGIFVSFIFIIATQDIAFSWSSTLDIDPNTFYNFLNGVSFLWRDIYPDGVVSLELISSSHYYRLEDNLNQNMLENVEILGDWWSFLALSTLFYAIFLRVVLLVIIDFVLDRYIKESILKVGRDVLIDINEPIISSNADTKEQVFISTDSKYDKVEKKLYDTYDSIQGWSFEKSELMVVSDSLNKNSKNYFVVGGARSFDEDEEVIGKSRGEVIVFVKAWEPPLMEFIDYIEELSQNVDKIVVYPVGLLEDNYKAKSEDIVIWENKLSLYDYDKVWLKK